MSTQPYSTTSVCLEQSCHLFVPRVEVRIEMEVEYAEIAYIELKKNIHIPIEWSIQGIENLVLGLVEKIIKNPGASTYILEVNNIPAKLIRRQTENGCVYVFQKVSHEEVRGAHLDDAVLPLDDHSVRIEISSGENQASGPWGNYCATASPREEETPLCSEKKFRSSQANDLNLCHCMLRHIERLSSSYDILLLILIAVFWFVCAIIIIYLNLSIYR